MGTVYLADDLRLPGRQCAVKEIRPPAGADEATQARARAHFAEEATVLARLDHPGLPGVSDCFEADDIVYLVMDYVPGQDLSAVVLDAYSRGRALDPLQVARWAEDLCRVLSYLHAQVPPVIHRDVKPANVKLTPDGQVRLVDFGLAQPLGEVEGRTVTVVAGAGSRPYQPLEQYGDGLGVDARSDVYALGATLFHLLVGRPPASAQDRFLEPGVLPRPRDLRPDLPPRLESAVVAALAMRPDDRPPTAEALRRLLVAPDPLLKVSSETWVRAVRADGWLVAVVIALLLAALALSVWP